MEPLGLAVGIVGLAGLFNTCLDILDKVDSWKNFEDESSTLEAQFEAQIFVFKRWGQAVGLGKKDAQGKEQKVSGDPELCIIVERLLESIKSINTWGEDTSSTSAHETEKSGIGSRLFPNYSHSNTLSSSKTKKLRWSLRDKAKSILQVQRLSALVDDLEKLIPTTGERDQLSSSANSLHVHDDLLSRDKCNADFERILSKLERDMEAETRRDIQAWLLGGHIPDDIHWEKINDRTDTTCQWIMDRPWFLEWLSPEFPAQRTKILWVHGPAGFGKSILCASVIDHLSSTRDAPVAYFFFSGNYHNTSDIFVAVRSWLTQMMSHPAAFDLIEENTPSDKGFKATNGEILDLLQKVVTEIPGCTLIIDGLDECRVLDDRRGEYENIETFIQALQKATRDTQSHIMLFSRGEPQIRNFLVKGAKTHSVVEHRITPQDILSDITSYSRHIVSKQLPGHTDEFKENLIQRLSELCEGQFLWIHLQKPFLLDGKGEKALSKKVETTPKGLGKWYEGDWDRIQNMDDDQRYRAVCLLRLVAFALRPLTVGEVTEAILIDQHRNEVHVDELPDKVDDRYIDTDLSVYFGSLLEVQKSSVECESAMRIVQLTHFSVKEFLVRKASTEVSILQPVLNTGYSTEQFQHTMIAMLCLRYIHFPGSWGRSGIDDENALGAFLPYASNFWHQHTALARRGDAELMSLVNELFDVERSSWKSWKKLYDETENKARKDGSNNERSSPSPIWYAARLGLNEAVESLIQTGKHCIDERGSLGQTALVATCAMGRLDVTKTLIAHGANIETPINDGFAPLDIALSNDHGEVARLLVQKGAKITGGSKDEWAPIHAASQRGYLEVVTLLLERGVDIHDKNSSRGLLPLHGAAWGGSVEVCRLLLANGAREDINVANNFGWTPLHEASRRGHHLICDLLLSEGADLRLADSQSRTPLHLASENGHSEVVKLLLDSGADATSPDDNGLRPIHSASRSGSQSIVALLLQTIQDVELPAHREWRLVHFACRNGHVGVLKLLLQNGADITVSKSGGWTPLHQASRYNHVEVVELLLQNGADLSATLPTGLMPVHLASRCGHLKVMRLLLQNGADITIPNSKGWSPIHLASANGHSEVVELLCQNGADITIAKPDGWTAIQLASRHGHLKAVDLLLQNGADVITPNSEGWTPAHMASRYGHLEVMNILLQNGAEIAMTKPDDGWMPIHLASANGHLDILKLILQKGIDPAITTPDGWSSAHLASRNGHLKVIEFLLENGADITISTPDKWTPVNLASRNGHLDVVKLLLQHRADVTIVNTDGWTPVHMASGYGYPEILKLLLQLEGASVHTRNNCGWTPVHLASANGHLETLKLLLENGAGVTATVGNNEGWTPVHHASRNGHLEVLRLLLQVEGVDVNAKDNEEWTPVHHASRYNCPEILKLLLQVEGVDVNAKNNAGWTAVHHASRYGHLEVVRALLQVEGVNLHTKNHHGWTPLHAAAMGGFVEVCQVLVEKGPEMNVGNVDGWTPLHEAAFHGHSNICDLLLGKGADLSSTDSQGRTPMDLALKKERREVMDIFYEYGTTSLDLSSHVPEFQFDHREE